MVSFFVLIYSISLFFILFDLNMFFVNEEFLVFICMAILFFMLVNSGSSFVKFTFFLRIEFIYFFFLYLILLNIKLIEKMMNLVSLNSLKFDSLVISELFNFFTDSVAEVTKTERLINTFLTKNFLFLLSLGTSLFHLISFSDYFTKIFTTKFGLVQLFDIKELNYSLFFERKNVNALLNLLSSSFLHDKYSISPFFSTGFNVNSLVDNKSILRIDSVDDCDLFIESSFFLTGVSSINA